MGFVSDLPQGKPKAMDMWKTYQGSIPKPCMCRTGWWEVWVFHLLELGVFCLPRRLAWLGSGGNLPMLDTASRSCKFKASRSTFCRDMSIALKRSVNDHACCLGPVDFPGLAKSQSGYKYLGGFMTALVSGLLLQRSIQNFVSALVLPREPTRTNPLEKGLLEVFTSHGSLLSVPEKRFPTNSCSAK